MSRDHELTGDLSVSSTYRFHFISTYNIKWETDLNTLEMMPCHLEPPAELSPLNCAVHLCPKSDEEGSWGWGRSDTRPEIRGQSDTIRDTDCSLFFCLSP